MSHEADRSDEERPSDADSGVRLSKNTGPGQGDATIADSNVPEDGASGRLPNWDDREKDERPGWEKAKIPKEEWLRAKASNDAALARETPGSPEFARLMEARMHLHLGPAPEVDFGEISAYKRSVYQDALAEDLRREIAEKEPEREGGLTTRRMMVAAGILVVVVVILFLIILQGPSTAESPAPTTAPTTTAQTKTSPTVTAQTQPPTTAATTAVEPSAPTTTTAVASSAPSTPTTTTAPAVTAKATTPTFTAKPTATAPASTGEVPFFKPKQKP